MTESATSDRLAAIALFRNLDPEARLRLARQSQYEHYDRDAIIDTRRRRALLVVHTGRLHVSRTAPDGRELILCSVGSGEVHGLEQINPRISSHSTVTAAIPSEVSRISIDAVRQAMDAHPDFAIRMVEEMSARLAAALDLAEELALCKLRVRLSRALARMAEGSADAMVHTTHEELAATIGASRSEVTRALRALREQGLVRYNPHQRGIEVPFPERLLEEAE